MARSLKVYWPVPGSAEIAALQSLVAAGYLNLNGTLSNPNTPNAAIILNNISRPITLTSSSNLSGVNFTIVGTFLGVPYQETIAGPNADTVSTANLFSSVTSIYANAGTGAATVSAGTGAEGITNPFKINEHASVCAVSAQIVFTSGAGDISYTFVSTIQEIDSDFSVTDGTPTIYNMINSTASPNMGIHGMLPITATGTGAPTYNVPVYGQMPIKYCWFEFLGSLNTPASLIAYIMQQGIT